MKKLLLVTAVLMTSVVNANDRNPRNPRTPRPFPNPDRNENRYDMEAKARKLANRVFSLTQMNATTLKRRELKELIRTLRSAKDILEGRVGPTPRPLPPIPRPLPPIPRPVYTCAQDSSSQYQATFSKIKAFAYSGDGINLSSSTATQFAQKWTNEYECQDANKYIRDFKYLKAIAYSGDYMNMSSSAAVNYAMNNVDKLCTDYDFKREFKTKKDFAYSSSGLNMSASQAVQYAKERTESRALSCSNFGNL